MFIIKCFNSKLYTKLVYMKWERAVCSSNQYLEDRDMLGDLEIDKQVTQKWFLIKRGLRLLLRLCVVKILSGVEFLMNTVLKLRFLY